MLAQSATIKRRALYHTILEVTGSKIDDCSYFATNTIMNYNKLTYLQRHLIQN